MFPITIACMRWSRAGAGRPGTPPGWQGPRHRRHFTPKLAGLEDRLLLSPGDLDLTFNATGTPGMRTIDFYPGSGSFDYASSVAIHQPDGKIVVAGSVEGPSKNWEFAVARLNPNGTLDTTFGDPVNPAGTIRTGMRTIDFYPGSGSFDYASSVAIQPDGKIVVAGSVQPTYNSNYDFGVARLNPNGTLDTTTFNATSSTPGMLTINFAVDGNVFSEDTASSVAIQPDGKIVVAGRTQPLDPVYHKLSGSFGFGVARLNTDGTLDTTTFGNKGLSTIDLAPLMEKLTGYRAQPPTYQARRAAWRSSPTAGSLSPAVLPVICRASLRVTGTSPSCG